MKGSLRHGKSSDGADCLCLRLKACRPNGERMSGLRSALGMPMVSVSRAGTRSGANPVCNHPAGVRGAFHHEARVNGS